MEEVYQNVLADSFGKISKFQLFAWKSQPIFQDLLTQEVNGLKVEFEEEALSYISKQRVKIAKIRFSKSWNFDPLCQYNKMLLDMGISPEDLRAEFENTKQLRLW